MKNVFAIGAERDGTSRHAQRVLITRVSVLSGARPLSDVLDAMVPVIVLAVVGFRGF